MNRLLNYEQASGRDWAAPQGIMLHDQLQQDSRAFEDRRQMSELLDLEDQMARYEAEHEALIKQVEKNYLLDAPSEIRDYLRSHRSISGVLIQALPHLRRHFPHSLIELKTSTPEDGTQHLYAVAKWLGTASDLKIALDNFDDEWWIHVSRKAPGLTYTYELI